jgi:hypothetical protein
MTNITFLREEGRKGRKQAGELWGEVKDSEEVRKVKGIKEVKVGINTDVRGNWVRNLGFLRGEVEGIREGEEWKGVVGRVEGLGGDLRRRMEGIKGRVEGIVGGSGSGSVREGREGEGERRKRLKKAKERRRKMRERGRR